ncbi:hypothetical protein BGX28_005524 [Mortierella sp. GBA30]|nr:hypothetical protein BGX28_005524 [Mortierella sp. GBA30]
MSPKKEKKPKRVVEEERTPKHVTLRLSYRDYLKLVDIGDVAAKLKESKEVKKLLNGAIATLDEELNADKFLGLVAGLPVRGEKSIERFHSQPPREAPTRMYFTDPEKCAKEVTELYQESKKYTKDKVLRYDQKRETCPTDVRVMFYAYVRGKGLVEEGNPDITVDKFLKKIAPKTLSGVKHVKRNNGSLVWDICSEIRGIKPKMRKNDEETSKRKSKKKAVVETSEEEDESGDESKEEPPKRRGKKVIESSEEESDEETSEDEKLKKNKPKRR